MEKEGSEMIVIPNIKNLEPLLKTSFKEIKREFSNEYILQTALFLYKEMTFLYQY